MRRPPAALLFAATVLLLTVACSRDTRALLPRDALPPLSAVTSYFPGITQEVAAALNETSVGKPTASTSVVFKSPDGMKKVTLSVDRYASASDAAAAYRTAVEGSMAAPGFKPASAPALGEEAFAGTSQVGDEQHFGLGARDGNLIVSATHAGDIPVTPENSAALTHLAADALSTAKRALSAPGE